MNKKTLFLVYVASFLIAGFISFQVDPEKLFAESDNSPDVTPYYNFVIILADDQRYDTLWAMPIVQEQLVRRGVTFQNAFVTTPLCCPDRSSFLAGGFYAHNTGVLTNELPNGGALKFNDGAAMPVLLQQKGYKTAMIGKYLNQYDRIAPYIPPGWSKFITYKDIRPTWMEFDAVIGDSGPYESTKGIIVHKDQYLTDFLRDEAIAFINQTGNEPFFLYLAPYASHAPAAPAPGDETLFTEYTYRGRGYGEEDLSDKPAYIRILSGKYDPVAADEFHRNQLRSLQAVDRTVGAIVDELKCLGKFDNTVFIYMADNGYLWGEHKFTAKATPYDESIRVPLVMVLPQIPPRKENDLVAANLDVPATIINLTGISKNTDGVSLLPLLKNPYTWRRKEPLLIEHFMHLFGGSLLWAGLRTPQFKYVEYSTGEKEFYDLVKDPYELQNQVNNSVYQYIIKTFEKSLNTRKGLAITTRDVPVGVVNQPYKFQITAWGGTQPYNWSAFAGELPQGLSLDANSGVISGIPLKMETQSVFVKVIDSSIAAYTGKPQVFVKDFKFVIDSSPVRTELKSDTAIIEEDLLQWDTID